MMMPNEEVSVGFESKCRSCAQELEGFVKDETLFVNVRDAVVMGVPKCPKCGDAIVLKGVCENTNV